MSRDRAFLDAVRRRDADEICGCVLAGKGKGFREAVLWFLLLALCLVGDGLVGARRWLFLVLLLFRRRVGFGSLLHFAGLFFFPSSLLFFFFFFCSTNLLGLGVIADFDRGRTRV